MHTLRLSAAEAGLGPGLVPLTPPSHSAASDESADTVEAWEPDSEDDEEQSLGEMYCEVPEAPLSPAAGHAPSEAGSDSRSDSSSWAVIDEQQSEANGSESEFVISSIYPASPEEMVTGAVGTCTCKTSTMGNINRVGSM